MCYPGFRVGVFSSPTNYYLGYATGTPSNNNAGTIVQRALWVASITPQPTYTIPLIINGSGTVVQNGMATNPAAFVVTRGQSLTLAADGNFICWTGATNTMSSNITLCPSQSTNLVANFVGVTSLVPQISVQPQGQNIGTGSTLTLVTEAVGVPTPEFQWQLDGTNIGTGSTLTISNVTTADEGNYQCVVSNTAGSVTSSAAAVVVDEPPAIIQQPVSQLGEIGGDAVFEVFADAVEPTYQWSLNGTSIPSATDRRFEISGITSQDAGNYTVAITSAGLTVESEPAQLILVAPPLNAETQTGPGVLTIVPVADGQMGIAYSGAAEQTCQIQASADLVQWESIGTITAAAGMNQFIDTNASQYATRYYRVMMVQ
jgi:hypothetical protein